MPTYQYACTECGHAFDQVQSFSDDALTVCPQCEGRLRKIYNAVGVVFKGSGFYRNDSRPGDTSGSDSSDTKGDTKGDAKGDSGKGDSGKGDSKPAESKPTADAASPSKPSGTKTTAPTKAAPA